MAPAKVPIEKRAAEFKKEGVYASGKILLCKWCNCRLDHERRDSLVKHCDSDKHIKKRDAGLAINPVSQSLASSSRQITMEETISGAKKIKIDREDFILETADAFLSANIPPEKLDNPKIRSWINKHVKGGGDLPSANTLRRKYVPMLGKNREIEIKIALKGKDLMLLSDETTDKGGRCVYNILAKTLDSAGGQTLYLLASAVLDAADSATCAKAIFDTLARYEIDYDNVVAFASDSARYMTKTFKVVNGLIEDLIHVQCWAHKIHLVGVIWQEALEELNNAVVKTKNGFLNTRKRKNHYGKHLGKKYGPESGKVKQFPIPVLTRWGSWFGSVTYLEEYLLDIIAFFNDPEYECSDGNAGVKYFKTLEKASIEVVQVQALHVVKSCKDLVELITFLEGTSYPTGHLLYKKVDDLCNKFTILGNGHFLPEVNLLLAKIPLTTRGRLTEQLKQAALKASVKLNELKLSDPAKKLWTSLGDLYDPRNLGKPPMSCRDLEITIKNVPFVKNIDYITFKSGHDELRRVVKEELAKPDCTHVDVVEILCSMKLGHPDFASASLKSIWLIPSNVDSERSFSKYSLVVSDRRRRLLPENAETLTMLAFD